MRMQITVTGLVWICLEWLKPECGSKFTIRRRSFSFLLLCEQILHIGTHLAIPAKLISGHAVGWPFSALEPPNIIDVGVVQAQRLRVFVGIAKGLPMYALRKFPWDSASIAGHSRCNREPLGLYRKLSASKVFRHRPSPPHLARPQAIRGPSVLKTKCATMDVLRKLPGDVTSIALDAF